MIRPRVFRFLLITIAVVVLLAATHTLWLPVAGYALIKAEPPAKADAALVLAGDGYGHRILRGAELVREGYVPKALVSGPPGNYGYYECDLAIPFAVKKGCPEQWFVRLPNEGLSTDAEADAVLPVIRKMGVKRLIVVTSDYHTARARRIYRAKASDLEIRVVAAPDEYFHADSWWRNRQARKLWALETWKTVAQWLGL